MTRQSVLHPLRATFAVAAAVAGMSCSDSVGPNPRNVALSPVLVSAPYEPALSPSVAVASAGIGTAYVSMRPGTESDAASVAVTNTRDGATVVAEVEEGGFDPIGIRAQPDDSLVVAVAGPDGVSLEYAKVPRRSRPVVVRTTPANRRTDIVLNPVIHVVFNEPMDTASLRGAVRLRRDGVIVPGTVSGAGVDDDYLTAIFVPGAPLEPNVEYELQVTADARSRGGAPVAEPVTIAFTTGSTSGQTATTGTLIVTTTTTGTGPYPSSYWMRIGGGFVQNIGINASIATQVPVGTHQVAFGGNQADCVLDGASVRTASIASGATVTVGFALLCGAPGPSPTSGTLVVSTITRGLETDPDGYALTIGATAQPIGMNATITAQVSPGATVVTLSGLADNCTQTGTGSVTVNVPVGTSLSIAFAVRCGPEVPGTVVVTTSTTGPGPGGTPYTVTLDGVSPWPISGNASITIPNVPPGYHHLKLSGVGGNCTVAAKTPETPLALVDQHGFYLSDSGSVPLGWQIQCQAAFTTSLTVRTATTGVEIDPDGYELHVAGRGTQRIDPNGSVVFPNLAAGGYELELRDLSANCAVAGHQPKRTVTLPSGVETTVTLGVTCTPDFHPAGVIAFTREAGVGRSAIFTANADGTGASQLTDGSSRDFDPAWSADGAQLAFIREQGQQTYLYTVNADGSGLRLRYTGSLSSAPSWAPDGRHITLSTYGNGEVGVHSVNLDDGSISARLGHPRGWASSPDWSPDGSRIAYTNDWHAFDFVYDVFVMNADGTNVRDAIFGSGAPWPTEIAFYFSPDWSPDGSKLLVSVCKGGYYVCWPDRWIAVTTGEGSGLTRIAYDGAVGTPLPWVDPDAVWSPDGATIAYHTTRCRGALRCIRYVRSGGGGSSVTLEDAYDPAWRP